MTTTLTAGAPLFSCPAPNWADEPTLWWNGTAEHRRFAKQPQDVSGWLQQYDALDVTDGVLTLVLKPGTIAVQFDGVGDAAYKGDAYPVDQWRAGLDAGPTSAHHSGKDRACPYSSWSTAGRV